MVIQIQPKMTHRQTRQTRRAANRLLRLMKRAAWAMVCLQHHMEIGQVPPDVIRRAMMELVPEEEER